MCLIVKVCQGKWFQPAYLDGRPSNSLIVCPRSPFYISASVTEASLLRLICRTDKSLWMLPNVFWQKVAHDNRDKKNLSYGDAAKIFLSKDQSKDRDNLAIAQ